MDINFLFDYINPIILGICLMVGFVLKTAFDKFPNKYIPLVALCMGTIIAILINLQSGINAEVILLVLLLLHQARLRSVHLLVMPYLISFLCSVYI